MRRRKLSGFSIDATWGGVDPIDGRIGRVWLADIQGDHEIWRWSAVWPDGSGSRADWRSSRGTARDECPVRGRFKRIK